MTKKTGLGARIVIFLSLSKIPTRANVRISKFAEMDSNQLQISLKLGERVGASFGKIQT